MMKKSFTTPIVSLIVFIGLTIVVGMKSADKQPNVLFICIDDLRPDLKVYGNPLIHAPNLDGFAKHATVFKNQFVTQPTCGASRYSLLTGRLPRNREEITNEAIEKRISGKTKAELPETFVENFRRNGYYTVGIGKISHSADGYVYKYTEPKSDKLELPNSWDEMLFDPGIWKTGWNAFFGYAHGIDRQTEKGKVRPYENADVPDEGYPDGLTANLAVNKLKELSEKGKPFFLSVGFFKPHLPFNAPKKYWDLYDESKINLTHSPSVPENVHAASLHGSKEFNQYQLGDEKASLDQPISDHYSRKLRHAYYAAISYTDAQIGKVLNELSRLGLSENTIVVIWSDHGWHLGDYRVWGKHTIFDQSVNSVLMVKTPKQKQGRINKDIVSSIDIYPTMVDLCDLNKLPLLDGKSFASALLNKSPKKMSNVAYSYYNRGISVRTDRYRLTKYFRDEKPDIELYDHKNDPNENYNVASKHPDIVKQLMPLLEKGNTGLFN